MENIIMRNYGYENGPSVRGFVDGFGRLRLNAENLLSAVVDGSDQNEIAAASAICSAVAGDSGTDGSSVYVTAEFCQELLDRMYGLDGGERQAEILERAMALFQDARMRGTGPENDPEQDGVHCRNKLWPVALAGIAVAGLAALFRRFRKG